LDLAVTWDLLGFLTPPSNGNETAGNSSIELGPVVEYHNNNTLAKPQDSLLTGAVFSESYGDPSAANPFLSVITGKAEYKEDRIAKSNGALATFDYSPIYGKKLGPREFEIAVQPTIGADFESSDKVGTTTDTGSTFRFKGSIQAVIYPFSASLKQRLQISSTFTFWKGFGKTGGFDRINGSQHEFEESLSYFFGPAAPGDATGQSYPIGISLDYLNGENPETSLMQNTALQLGLKIKL